MVTIVISGLFFCGSLCALMYGALLAHNGREALQRAAEISDRTTALLRRYLDFQMEALREQRMAAQDDDDDDFATILRMGRERRN